MVEQVNFRIIVEEKDMENQQNDGVREGGGWGGRLP